MSLTSGVKFNPRETDAILMLLHAYQHLLFADGSEWDTEPWAKALRTLRKAKFQVQIEAICAVPGMRGAL